MEEDDLNVEEVVDIITLDDNNPWTTSTTTTDIYCTISL